MEFDNLVLLATQSLMSTDDVEGARLAALAEASLQNVMVLNNDLYVGNGVPDINNAAPEAVCWRGVGCSSRHCLRAARARVCLHRSRSSLRSKDSGQRVVWERNLCLR